MFAPKNWWWVSKPILVFNLGPCPTLGRSISFPCSQLQCAAQDVTISISAFLRPSVCSLIFTLEHSKQDVSPVFHKCFTSVSQVFHQCFLPVFRTKKMTSCSIVHQSQTMSNSIFGFLTLFHPIFWCISPLYKEICESNNSK